LESEFEDSLKGRRVLITGSRGFIGAHLARALVGLGAFVVGSARSWSAETPPGRANPRKSLVRRASEFSDGASTPSASPASASAPTGLIPLECDLCDFAATRQMLWTSQPEIIFHLAATVTARESLDLVQPTLNNIVAASVNLMNAAAEARCKLIVTCATSEQPADDSPPVSPYAAAKECVSTYCQLFRHKFGLEIREVMPFLTFGPGQDEAKLIPHIITSLLFGVSPKLSDATRTFDLVYIDDVVRGIIMTALHPEAIAQPVELGSGAAITVTEIVQRIVRLIESDMTDSFRRLIEPDMTATFDSSDKRTSPAGRVADLSHSLDTTGWLPIWTLDEALQETIAWYHQRCKDG